LLTKVQKEASEKEKEEMKRKAYDENNLTKNNASFS
jgi:hypothetical protein